MSVLSAALSRLNRLQSERKISPPILSYNNVARTVSLVDRELLFFRRHTKRKWPWQMPGYLEEVNNAVEAAAIEAGANTDDKPSTAAPG